MRYTMDIHKMPTKPIYTDLFDVDNRMKMC
jgi:hypothetical protein